MKGEDGMKAIRCKYKDGVRLATDDKSKKRWFLCPMKNIKVGDWVLVEFKIQRKNKKTGTKISNRYFGVQRVDKILDDIQYNKSFLEKWKITNFVVCKVPVEDMDVLGWHTLHNRKRLIEFYRGDKPFKEKWQIVKVKHRANIKWKMDMPSKLYHFVTVLDDLKVGDYVLVEYRKCLPKISQKKDFPEGEIAEVNHFSVARIEEFVETNEMSMRDICPIAFVVCKLPSINFDERIAEVKKFKALYYQRYRHQLPYAKKKNVPSKKNNKYKAANKTRRKSVIYSWSADDNKK